jgi:catechol 2,3-dioxygenase
MTDTSIDIGPTRHGLTHGKTIYFFDPSGNRNEVFCGGDYTYPDHKPVTWQAEQLGKAIFYHDRVLNERFLTVLT